MSETIRDTLLNAVKTALENISTANGYNQDTGLVEMDELRGPDEMKPDEFPALFIIDGDEPKEPGDVDSTKCDLQIIITGYLKKINDEDNVQRRRRRLQGDVEKALMADDRFGEKAISTDVQKIQTDKGTIEPFAIFDMDCVIKYYHDRGNPFSQDNSG